MEAIVNAENDLTLLARVMAAADAVWLPLRACEWKHPCPAAIYTAQQSYRKHPGVIVPMPGTALARKRAELAIDRLVQAGHLTARRRGRGRYLRLTDETEDRLRIRCGLPGLWLSFETARRLPAGQLTPEIEMNDGRGWGDGHENELRFVEYLMLPALARGFAKAESTIRGHVWYRQAELPADWPMPGNDEPPDDNLARLYVEELCTTRKRLAEADVGHLEIGFIPLPCSTGG
jgi:DNA-binding transcriptional ArsR family regulator